MQDFCFKTTMGQATLTAALETLGLVVDGQVVGDWIWVGQVVSTPGTYDPETGEEIAAPVYLDGEYAVYRATDAQAAVIEAATWPDGVELVDPPTGVPMFGGEWLQPDLAALQAEACARIETERQTRLAAGISITWPDGVTSLVQTRDTQDWINIQGIAAAGLALLTQGETTETWFRDADNADHTLTPTQAVDFGFQVTKAASALAKVAQTAKDAINLATDAAGVKAAEAAVVWPS